VSESDPIAAAAKALAADLHAEPDAVQEVVRYLLAQIAVEQGLLELMGEEAWPTRTRREYVEPTSGAHYVVTRPRSLTCDEEAEYVAELRRALVGDS
jgi:hypothetical protein